MNRNIYFNNIEEQLLLLSRKVSVNNTLNLQDINIHCENFYGKLLNILFGYNLMNINTDKPNACAVDLIDKENKICVQVTSSITKSKIEGTLKKLSSSEYNGYHLLMVFITDNPLKPVLNKEYFVSSYIQFDVNTDTYNVTKLLRIIKDEQDIDKIKKLYSFINKELGVRIEPYRIQSALVSVVKTLASENLEQEISNKDFLPFSIKEKIEFNKLTKLQDIIKDFSIYYTKLNDIYDLTDSMQRNTKMAILNSLRITYKKLKLEYNDSESLFFAIIESLTNKVISKIASDDITEEEIELCVQIIVVDAFIRCEIFEKPLSKI